MAAPEWLDTALHIGEPLAGVLIGFAGTVFRYRRKIRSLSGMIDAHRATVEGYKLQLEQLINAARAAAVEGDKAAMRHYEQRLQSCTEALGARIALLEVDIKELQSDTKDQSRASAHDHAKAAALAQDMLEVQDQCRETLALLNEIRGYMKATGAKL